MADRGGDGGTVIFRPFKPGERCSDSLCICDGPGHFPGEGCGDVVKDGLCQACVDDCCAGPSIDGIRACAKCNAEFMRPVGDKCPNCKSTTWRTRSAK